MDYTKIIGSNVRFERQKRDLTIEELSEILNMAPGFLGLIERGQRGTSLKNLCRIADFFSITLDDLVKRYISEEFEVKEESILEQRRTTASSLINTMDSDELEYIISNIKALKRYTNIKYNEFRNIPTNIEEESDY